MMDIEFIVSKRFPKAPPIPAFRTALANNLKKLPRYDVVIVGDDNAFSFALQEQGGLFRSIPLVFLVVYNIGKVIAQNNDPQVTGVVEEASDAGALKLVRDLYPTAEKIYIGHKKFTSTGRANTRRTRAAVRVLGIRNAEFISMSKLTYDKLWHRLSRLPAGAPLILNGAYRDRLGKRLDYLEVLNRTKEAFGGAVFSSQQHGIGHGVVGGYVVCHMEQGRIAGNKVVAILSGVPVGNIKVAAQSPNIFLFDHNELARLGLEDRKLPSNSEIINQPKEKLRTYAEWLIAGMTALGLQMTLIVVLVRTIRRRRTAETALRDSENRPRAFLDHSPS
jgi:two-component system cell cycle sensor histidine kinase/response regulator CckA